MSADLAARQNKRNGRIPVPGHATYFWPPREPVEVSEVEEFAEHVALRLDALTGRIASAALERRTR